MLARPAGCVVLLILSLAFIAGCSSQTQVNETMQRGNRVLAALEKFRADQGHYPKSLAELAPKYLPEVPPPTWGLRTWQYEAGSGDYTLQVNESVHTGDGNSRWLRYMGEKWGWQMGD